MQDGAFHGRVAIVTGAGQGIGQATAIAFSKLGAAVVLYSQSKEPLMETLALIERSGGKAIPVVGDVSNERVRATRFRGQQRGHLGRGPAIRSTVPSRRGNASSV